MRFWDSSAVVPLVVGQRGTAEAEAWIRRDPQVVLWTLTPIEVLSAIRRLVRAGAVGEDRAAAAEDLLEAVVARAHLVVDVERVKRLARRLLRVHPLRAGDALQLGAAVAWAGGEPAGRTLHALDQRLAAAARHEGFVVEPRS
jgi:predicted nucleic acid-binding protein